MADRDHGTSATRKGSLWLSKTKPSEVLWDTETGGFTSSRDLGSRVDDGYVNEDDSGEVTAAVEDVVAREDDDPSTKSLSAPETSAADIPSAESARRSAEAPASASASAPGASIGAHLKDSHVFTVEILSNRTIKAVMIVYYIIFVLLLVYGLSEYRDTHVDVPLSIAPRGSDAAGNESALLCLPNPEDGTCEPDPSLAPITLAESNLLSNTMLVSEGLNISNWIGDRAKPGTPPFSAHNKSTGAFLLDSSGLEYSANPDLHDVWEDLSGAFWFGSSRTEAMLQGGEVSRSSRSVRVSLKFARPDGTSWPEGSADGTLPLTFHAYACLKGQDCSSVGSYRGQFLPTPNLWVPERTPYRVEAALRLDGYNGSVVSASFDVPNTMVVEDVLDSVGWRFAASADPGGAVSACAAGDNCVVVAALTSRGTEAGYKARAGVETAALICYFPYLVWWLVTACVRLGMNVKMWPLETIWLLFLGVGFLMYNGFLYVSISIKHLQPDFVFKERLWAAASILSMLGQVLQYFSLACFTDSPRRYVVSPLVFYGWKFLFCLILWTSMFVTVMYHYPLASGRDEPGTDLAIGGLGFPTAPETWPRNEKIVLSTFQLLWLACIFFAIGYYFWVSQRTKRVLADLPYNMTRPVQLSFRFFRWATLIWIISEFVTLIGNIAASSGSGYNYSGYADGGLNALVVILNQMEAFQVHANISKVLFGLVFVTVYLGFFLPPPLASAVRKSHHVTEEQAKKVQKDERTEGEFLLVLDRARLLCTCSREVYLPFSNEERRRDAKVAKEEEIKTASTCFGDDEKAISAASKGDTKPGAALRDKLHAYLEAPEESKQAPKQRGGLERVDSWMPTETFVKKGDPHPWLEARIAGESVCWGKPSPPGSTFAMNCRVVKRITEPSYADMHDSRAIIFRHEPSQDLIIAFRGTKTGKQVKTDLMTQKVEVSLDTFLTISSATERARRLVEGVLPEDIEEKMQDGTAGKVKILDLLHRDNDEELPEFLRGRSKAGDGIRGHCNLHFGFFSSYSRLRKQVHTAIYDELVAAPGRLLVCGHSLGGAQATACAYDMSRWIIPSAKKALLANQGKMAADRVTLCCYTYGSPRLGGPNFQAAFDKAVPETQRIINDGDVVTLTPPSWLGFRHVGTEDIFDYTGSLMANPSLIEKKFANKTRTHANAHRLPNYTKAIKRAYQPVMPIEELLGMIRDAYGLSGDLKERDHWANRS